MKLLIIIALTTTITFACIAPIKPIPPIGCTWDNAVLVHQGNQCYWVYMNCGIGQ